MLLVLMLATSVNTGRFLEYSLEWDAGGGDNGSTVDTEGNPLPPSRYYNTLTPLMSDTRYGWLLLGKKHVTWMNTYLCHNFCLILTAVWHAWLNLFLNQKFLQMRIST